MIFVIVRKIDGGRREENKILKIEEKNVIVSILSFFDMFIY